VIPPDGDAAVSDAAVSDVELDIEYSIAL